MEKRYQVFVSSTYEDLRVERQEVIHALLELDCMPAGMELFPAADADQWSLIKKVIDECDYYLVISAGRYGSISPHGQGHSYTEMEYRYALEAGKPVIAFLHKDPFTKLTAGVVESSKNGRKCLNAFRALLQLKVCKYWETPTELGSVVSRSVVRLIKTSPAVGWIRADEATESLAAPEVLRLRKRIEELEDSLEQARIMAPSGSEKLSKGDDQYPIDFTFDAVDQEYNSEEFNWAVDVSWNDIFYDIGPILVSEATDRQLRKALTDTVRIRSQRERSRDKRLKQFAKMNNFQISDHDFQTIKLQLRALGLITKSQRPRSLKDSQTYWMLTPYGDQVLTTLRAIPKPQEETQSEAVEAVDKTDGLQGS